MALAAQVEEDGFAIVHDILSGPEAVRLRQELDQSGLPRSRAGIRHVLSHSGVSRFANDSRVLGIVRKILGENAIPFRTTLFDKSPTANWLVMWHQDTAVPLTVRKESEGWGPWSLKDGVTYAHAPATPLEQVLAVHLHLDDSNLGNGPLRILPGTHKAGVLTDQEIQSFSEQMKPIDYPVSLGGVLLMRPLAVHASSKSASTQPRQVLHIEYATQREILPRRILAIA